MKKAAPEANNYLHLALTRKVIGAAIEVHKHMGPGLLESTYKDCLIYELENYKLNVQSEVSIPLVYKEFSLRNAYKLDLLIEDLLIVELK